MLINNVTYQRETVSERPIRQPLNSSYMQVLGELSRPVSTGSTQGQAERTMVLFGQLQRKPEKRAFIKCAPEKA